MRLSPTSINTYFRSPRLFYYNYILKMKNPPNIHLYKGNFVHDALEKCFASTKYRELLPIFEKNMEKWNPPKAIIEHMSEDELGFDHKAEAFMMLKMFARRFEDKLEMIMWEGKARDKNHAWNLIKPKLKEYRITDKERNILGIIDSVETNFHKQVYIIDYKTSKLYRHTLPEDYVRQLSLYAYMYRQEFGTIPDYVGINYLRYGEVYMFPVTEDLVKKAEEDIDYVRTKITSTNIEDYPKGNDNFALRDIEYFEEKLGKTDKLTKT